MLKTLKYFCIAAGASGLASELSFVLRTGYFDLIDLLRVVVSIGLMALGVSYSERNLADIAKSLTDRELGVFSFGLLVLTGALGVLTFVNIHSTIWAMALQ